MPLKIDKEEKENRHRVAVKVLVPLCLPVLVSTIYIELTSLDGLSGEMWKLFCQDTSVFAPGYSDKNFKEVKLGMTEEDVISLLGPPLYIMNELNQHRLCYSESSTSSHYRIRQIYIADGRVVEISSYFYLD